MSNRTLVITNMTSGEVSPKMAGRIDVDQYKNGGLTIENALISHYGSVYRRPGTYYANETKDSSKNSRLIPFEFSTEQAYILEFGHQYMRVFKDGGIVLSGSSPYEITTDFDSTKLSTIQYAQDSDVMYQTEPSTGIYKLSRTGHTSWTHTKMEPSDFGEGPFMPVNNTSTTLTPGATSGNTTLTASTAFFNSGHVNALFKLNGGYCKVTSYTSATVVNITVISNFTGTSATDEWYEGAWSDYRGWPRAVTLFEQRLVFGGSESLPQTVWGSVSEEYENFLAGDEDSDAILYTLASDQVNTIEWFNPGVKLIIGTAGAVFTMAAGTSTAALTPTNVVVKRETAYGGMSLQSKKIGNYVYYMQRNTRTLREFFYQLETDSYTSADANLLSDHITESGIVDMSYMQSPDDVLWCVRSDGQVATLTRQIAQRVRGWSRQILGGSYGSGGAVVESAAIIPNGEEDQIWFIVKRTVNGDTVRYVEYMKAIAVGDNTEDAFFVDCGLSYDGTATSTVSNLDHLEGETVAILADGKVHPNQVVSSGSVSLNYTATKVHVGLPFTTTIKTMDLEATGDTGYAQGFRKRILKGWLRLYKTIGVNVGNIDSQDRVLFRSWGDLYGAAVDYFTGDKEFLFNSGFETNTHIVITQEQPLPLHLLSIIAYMEVSN